MTPRKSAGKTKGGPKGAPEDPRGATVLLAGGGPGAVLAMRRHFKAALAALPVAKPLVAYVGTASKDSAGFFHMFRAALGATGVRMQLAKLASPRAKTSEARALLEEADLVFVSGGDVELGMSILHERDAAGTLRALAKKVKPMFGVSAGSLMLAREWVRFPGDDETRAEIFPCLGIAPLHVDAHSEDDGWSELRILVRLLHQRGDGAPVGYGLTRKGAIYVDVLGGGAPLPVGTDAPRIVVRRGQVVESTPLRTHSTT
jgi:peptidase E